MNCDMLEINCCVVTVLRDSFFFFGHPADTLSFERLALTTALLRNVALAKC